MTSPNMPPPVDLETYIRLGAAALDLPLDHANIAEIERNLALAFRLAEAFTSIDPGDEAEPAPLFDAFATRTESGT